MTLPAISATSGHRILLRRFAANWTLITPGSVFGEQTSGTIRISRTGPNSLSLSGTILFAPSTPTNGRATLGVDYSAATSWTISGSDHSDISISVLNDREVEGGEIIVVLLNDEPTKYHRSIESVETTIQDNDRWQWKPFTGTQLGASQSKTMPGYDGTFDLGNAHLTMSAHANATSHSVSALLDGEFYDPDWFTYNTYRVSDSADISFDFDAGSGNIFVSSASSNSAVEGDGPLQGTLGMSYSIDNSTRTATVKINAVVLVGGSITTTASGGLEGGGENAGINLTGSVGVTHSVTTTIGDKITASKTFSLQLENVED